MRLLLLGSQVEDFGRCQPVIICLYNVVDERGDIVAGASSVNDANRLCMKFANKYPTHTFSVVNS